jgi:hypothetical protein
MKNILIIILAAIAVTTYSYTENQIKLNINRNNRGEILLNITGHTSPVIVEMNGKSITFNVGDNETNLDEAIDVKVDDMDTASGVEQSSIDSQIPPVSNSINPNPPLATPY